MKILFILNSFYATGNGLSASARRTVQTLRDAGQEVRVVSGPNRDPAGPKPDYELKWFYFPIFQPIIDAQGYSFASTDKKIIEEAMRWADVVHMEEPMVLEARACRIAQRLGKPVTGTYHLHPENVFCSLALGWSKVANHLLINAWRDLVFNHCSHLQCPTENVCERLERHYFKSKLHVFSNGVVKYKPEFKFCTRDELRALAAGADLCVHCATIEVEGLSIMEAMQQGAVPVIAQGRHSGTSQFALSDRSVFQEKNEKELAEKIDWWLSHPKERWEEGKRYAESMKKYHIDKSAQALIEMFKAALEKK